MRAATTLNQGLRQPSPKALQPLWSSQGLSETQECLPQGKHKLPVRSGSAVQLRKLFSFLLLCTWWEIWTSPS